MRLFFLILLVFLPMSIQAGNFFPPEYKQFPFAEGDLLVSKGASGKFAVNKILRVDRFVFRKGSSIGIQGQRFFVSEDDHLLIVSASYGEAQFDTFDEARAAAGTGKWSAKIGHVPNRAPGAAQGQTRVGNAPVTDAELEGYRLWRQAFEKGEASVF